MNRESKLAHVALIVSGLLFGANYWIAKSLMPEYLNPVGIIVLRTSGALFLFALILPFARKSKFTKKEWLLLVLSGLCGVTINQFLFFEGLNLSTPVETSLLHTISPIVVVVMAAWLIREKTRPIQFAGIALGFVGAIMLTLSGKELSWDSSHLTGNIFILINITAYSIYLVLVKPVMRNHDPIKVTFWVFFFGWLFFLPIGIPSMNQIFTMQWPAEIWGALIYVVVGTTFITYLLTMYALQRVNAGTVGYYIYLQPLISGSIGIITGMELLNAAKIVSALLIFAGVFLVNWAAIRTATTDIKHTIKRQF